MVAVLIFLVIGEVEKKNGWRHVGMIFFLFLDITPLAILEVFGFISSFAHTVYFAMGVTAVFLSWLILLCISPFSDGWPL